MDHKQTQPAIPAAGTIGQLAIPLDRDVFQRSLLRHLAGTLQKVDLGYSKVVIDRAIARGDKECKVVVHLKPTPEAGAGPGREHYKS